LPDTTAIADTLVIICDTVQVASRIDTVIVYKSSDLDSLHYLTWHNRIEQEYLWLSPGTYHIYYAWPLGGGCFEYAGEPCGYCNVFIDPTLGIAVGRCGELTGHAPPDSPDQRAKEAQSRGLHNLGFMRGEQSGIYGAYKAIRRKYPDAAAYLLKRFGMNKDGSITF
jgi:hypothetical protein